MRLKYFGLGDIARVDEFNALATILLHENTRIHENIMLLSEGEYKGAFASYSTTFEEGVIDYRDEDFVIKDNGNILKVSCNSDVNCYFILSFLDKEFVSNKNNEILVDLSYFENETIVPNQFTIDIRYDSPYINIVDGGDGINTSSELMEAIQLANNEATILLENTLTHDLDTPISINKTISLKPKNSTTLIEAQDNTGVKLFTINNEGKLQLENMHFQDFTTTTTNDKGAVIYNKGELNLNNCIFYNCTNTNGDGIIYSEGNINSDHTEFNTCTSRNGGALYVTKE